MVPEYLERLLANSEVVPATNQIESHPYGLSPISQCIYLSYRCRSCPQEEIIEFCRSKGIIVTAYSPLGSNDSPLLANPVVLKLAEKYQVQPSNILISLQANKPGVTGMQMPANTYTTWTDLIHSFSLVIPKSVTNSRIAG